MAEDTSNPFAGNPFVLPGLGQSGDAAANPVLAGLEMMRQAWQGMAGVPAGPGAGAWTPASAEALEQRIRELQTIQGWLQMNATMLASTIQGLEIQRSTLRMFESLTPQAAPAAPRAGTDTPAQDAAADAARAEAAPDPTVPDYTQAAAQWWTLAQRQFEQLAQATAASLQAQDGPSDPPAASGSTNEREDRAQRPSRRTSRKSNEE